MNTPNPSYPKSRIRHCFLHSYLGFLGVPISGLLLSVLAIGCVSSAEPSAMAAESDTDLKVRIRHVGTDLCLGVVDGSVVTAKYSPEPSFWWHTSQDIGGKVGFHNVGSGEKTLAIPSGGPDAQKLVVSGDAPHAEKYWLFSDTGGIYNLAYLYKDVSMGLHVPKDAKPGDTVQLASNNQEDAFVLEPIPKSGEPARLTVEESWNGHLEHFRPPPGAVN